MKKDLVSIIIPYYKKKKYFTHTITSIFKQSYKNYEIIIIYDDPSKVELPYVKKQLKKFKKKRLIINKINLGAGLSRNKGIKFSKGKYIAFCDADDLWHHNKLKTQLLFMKKNNLSFSHTSYNVIDSNGKKISCFNVKKKMNYHMLLESCDVGLSSVMCKKIILKNKFFLSTTTKEDYFLWLNIIKKINFIYGIQKKLASWRKLENSLSSSVIRKIVDAFKMYYIISKKHYFLSLFYTTRLSFRALIKKFTIYYK